jgi:hypothetical protein
MTLTLVRLVVMARRVRATCRGRCGNRWPGQHAGPDERRTRRTSISPRVGIRARISVALLLKWSTLPVPSEYPISSYGQSRPAVGAWSLPDRRLLLEPVLLPADRTKPAALHPERRSSPGYEPSDFTTIGSGHCSEPPSKRAGSGADLMIALPSAPAAKRPVPPVIFRIRNVLKRDFS